VILSFRDTGTEDLFDGKPSKAARKVLPTTLWKVARRRLEQLDSAGALGDLRVPPGNRLEALGGDRKGQHSIRINDQYRICFAWTENGPTGVEATDYH
jgi:proteic killer suppression protein